MVASLVDRHPREERFATPLLLVPGAFCGTWVWEDRFLDAFAQAGFRSYAVQFRGHGGSWLGRQRFGLADCVDDLQTAIATLPRKPVLIAHSLGALAAVRLLARISLPGAVLLAPVPPDGAARPILSLARLSPTSVAKLASLAVFAPLRHVGDAPLGMYSSRLWATQQAALPRRLAGESARALLDALRPVRAKGRLRSTPIHVIGAEGDALIAPTDVRRCARLLGATCDVLPGRSHMLMAEPGWRQITDSIVRWIDLNVDDGRPRAPGSKRRRRPQVPR